MWISRHLAYFAGIALLAGGFDFPDIEDWNSLRMGLTRTGCYGSCPTYSVEVKGTGEVDFLGESNVLVKGRHGAHIPKQLVRDLVTYFEDANYFSLKDEYVAPITDHPAYMTWIEFDGRKKSVLDYAGVSVGMPRAVEDLERAIDEFAGTEKWVKGNDQTRPALKAEKRK